MKLHRAAALLFGGLLPAQRQTWIVDAANGAGTHFRDLPPAVAAAAAGDAIRVRPGDYSGITISKALTILGGAGVRLRPGAGFLHVANLPAGQQVVVNGVHVVQPASPGASFTNNQGRILLDRVNIVTNVLIYFTDCRQIELNGCWLRGGSVGTPGIAALTVTRSTVLISSTLVEGPGGIGQGASWGAPAVTAYDSRIYCGHSQLDGGGGNLFGPPSPAAPGILAYNSNLWIAGAPDSRVRAGQISSIAMPAIATGGGTVEIDPRVTLTPFSSAPPIYGSASVTYLPLAALKATGAPPGAIVRSELLSRPGDLLVAVVSLASGETPFGASGSLWIDPNRFLLVTSGVQGASGSFPWTVQVPNDAVFQLDGFTQQAISGTLANGFRLSNPASYAHN
jgi:hypothetical protein